MMQTLNLIDVPGVGRSCGAPSSLTVLKKAASETGLLAQQFREDALPFGDSLSLLSHT
jgi:hypothetical protein